MSGWESYGYKRGECSSCSTPAELVYEEHPGDPISEFDNQRDKLRRYLGVKAPDMPKEEPMEELDFNPFLELIERQSEQIDVLKELIEDLQNKVTELESDLADRDDALSQIERLSTLYV